MGYNTVVIVLNDALHDIENDPEFGKKLSRAISAASIHSGYRQDVSARGFVNAASVISTAHADVTQLTAVGGNYGTTVGFLYTGGKHHESDDWVKMLKQWAEKLGFRVSRKKALKTGRDLVAP